MAARQVERRRFRVTGTVQGVGFRPLVFRLAAEHGVRGYVANQRGDVTIEAEGSPEQVAQFRDALLTRTEAPARIDGLEEVLLTFVGYEDFRIWDSSSATGSAPQDSPTFPPDLAVCPTCLSDVTDPDSRYAGYPFTSCTYCGPRYAIVEALPYDRATTTMAPFALCESCRAEYENPLSRRFHAQTIACPDCGPRVEVRSSQGTRVEGDWLVLTRQALASGAIVAAKGLGGFHLLCDAAQEQAVERLRARKRRPRKPFALMVRDITAAEDLFLLTEGERNALADRRAPILLLRPRPFLSEVLPLASLAPGHQRLGVMLAYTPLHSLLFRDGPPILVATSGNRSGLPIARTNQEALAQLGALADLFLLHDREIAVRVEDSVCQWADGALRLVRRSRGYVPEALTVPLPPGLREVRGAGVLAAGAELKNTVCLLQGDQAVLGHFTGDVDGEEHLAAWRDGVRHLTQLSGTEPGGVAYDPHPGYMVSREAQRAFAGKRLIPVFHHHAHLAACMAEHGLAEPVIGCILDGTGFGPDGGLWGFEILAGDYLEFQRLAHLKPLLLPGGEAAIRQPWLAAVSLLHDLAQDTSLASRWAEQFFPERRPALPLVMAQLDGRLPAPRASSAGRLFDGVAALLGLCTVASYEGEAAVLLGEQAEAGAPAGLPSESQAAAPPEPETVPYPVALDGRLLLTAPLVRGVLADLHHSVPAGAISRRFHRTVAEMVRQGALLARAETGLQKVVLGGGVWQNRYLLPLTRLLLEESGFQVYSPQRVPAGDGGIALGQAVSALWRWHRDVSGGTGEGA